MHIRLQTEDGKSQFVCMPPFCGSEYVCASKDAYHFDDDNPSSQSHLCACGSNRIRGTKGGFSDRGCWSAAVCNDCDLPCGKLIVSYSTIFGSEEDARVTGAAWKVY